VIIGVDPHKSTHTVVAIDRDERPLARVQLVADRCQVQRLLAWAEPLGTQRSWAVESAEGLGKLLAQQLLEASEQVIDVLRRSRRGSGCRARPRRARSIPTTRWPRPSPGCGTADSGRCGWRITPTWDEWLAGLDAATRSRAVSLRDTLAGSVTAFDVARASSKSSTTRRTSETGSADLPISRPGGRSGRPMGGGRTLRALGATSSLAERQAVKCRGRRAW
jgi:hypothetical protein